MGKLTHYFLGIIERFGLNACIFFVLLGTITFIYDYDYDYDYDPLTHPLHV